VLLLAADAVDLRLQARAFQFRSLLIFRVGGVPLLYAFLQRAVLPSRFLDLSVHPGHGFFGLQSRSGAALESIGSLLAVRVRF